MASGARHPGLHDASGAELPARLIDVAGAEAHVVDAGRGPTVVLLHGFGDTADSWRRVVPRLVGGHRVVALDIPPFGRSSGPSLNGTSLVAWYEEFFPALLQALGLRRVTLVGHSFGGAVALHSALERPKVIEQLVLIAPAGLGSGAPWWWQAAAGRPVNWAALLKLPNPVAGQAIRAGMRSFLEERLLYDNRQMEDVIEHFLTLHGGRRELDELLATGRALIPGYDGTLIERVTGLRCPVTLIWGRDDRLAPVQHAEAFATAVPHTKVEVFERCGHYPQVELPGRVIELLEQLL